MIMATPDSILGLLMYNSQHYKTVSFFPPIYLSKYELHFPQNTENMK